MKRIFDPRTIALIGATDREGSVGKAVLENLMSGGGREVYPVNPNRDTALGVKCYPSIYETPRRADLAVITTPAQSVPELVEDCGKAGVGGVIIVSAGFKETGEGGRGLETKIRDIRKKYGIRVVGPNCLGVIRPGIGLNASFLKVNPEPGKIAFISQSGALGSAILDWAVSAHIGFSMFASIGSMIDVDFGDMIDYLGEDPETRSIILYMEGVGDARKFMSAARGFARNKPIIVVKPGRFPESAKAARSHTGAMAGESRVYESAFRRVGVLMVKEVDDLFNCAGVLDSKYLPEGPSLAIITNAGGMGVMATDELIELGGRLAKLSDKTIEKLGGALPEFWSRGNPVDVLGDADVGRYSAALQGCLEDSDVDGVVVIYTPQGAASPDELARAVADAAKKSSKPVIGVWMGGEDVRKAREMLQQDRIPAYANPEDAVRTYHHMYRYARNLQLLYETPAELSLEQSPSKNHLKAQIRRIAREGRSVLTEDESKGVLSNYGIPVILAHITRNVDDALEVAGEVGYPLVLKVLSPDITHKSDVGGVATGIYTPEQLRERYGSMVDAVRERVPHASIAGLTVQKMVEAIDYELILGMKKDKDFGSVVLFGMGGVGAEVFKDFSIGLPPLNQSLAARLMEETNVYRMLQGFRGRPPADIRRLEEIIVNFSNLVVDFPEIAEIDVNPVAVSGGKAYALDARIVIDKHALEAVDHYPHMVITPYPTRYVMPWRMQDGTEITLRPIRPEDEPLEQEMLSTLSEESLKHRFFQVIKTITHEMLFRFCNIDYDREMAIVGEVKEHGKRRIVGIGRLIMDPDFRDGEFAVVVHDDYQGKGLGYKLIDMLIGIAQERGLSRMHGDVLSENRKMLSVASELGFVVKPLAGGLSRVELLLK